MERFIATISAVALTLTLLSGITFAQWIAAAIVAVSVPLLYRSITRRAEARAKRQFWTDAEAIIASSGEQLPTKQPSVRE